MENIMEVTKKMKLVNIINPVRKGYRKPRLLFDMDDILALFVPELLKRFNAAHGTNHKVEDCVSWYLTELFGEDILDFSKQENFYESLEPVPGAIETFKRLYESEKYEMYIVSAGEAFSCVGKIAWLQKYMPFFPLDNFILTKSKDAVWGDLLFDDGPHNAEKFKDIGLPVVFDMPYNRHLTNYLRVYSWEEFERLVEKIFYGENPIETVSI